MPLHVEYEIFPVWLNVLGVYEVPNLPVNYPGLCSISQHDCYIQAGGFNSGETDFPPEKRKQIKKLC